jgi:hypothetical protein
VWLRLHSLSVLMLMLILLLTQLPLLVPFPVPLPLPALKRVLSLAPLPLPARMRVLLPMPLQVPVPVPLRLLPPSWQPRPQPGKWQDRRWTARRHTKGRRGQSAFRSHSSTSVERSRSCIDLERAKWMPAFAGMTTGWAVPTQDRSRRAPRRRREVGAPEKQQRFDFARFASHARRERLEDFRKR